MKHANTRLSLTSLDDRIVPSTSLADPGKSGVVNAIYVDGTTDTGVTTGPYRPSEINSGAVTEFASYPITPVNTERPTPQQPTLPSLPVVGPRRDPSDVEKDQIDRLLALIEGLDKRVTEIKEELKTLDGEQKAQKDAVDAQQSRVDTMRQAYDMAIRASVDYRLSDAERAAARDLSMRLDRLLAEDKRTLKALTDNLNATTAKINDLQNQLYQNLRKIVEMRDDINRIRQRSDNGHPQVVILAPPEVFDITKIGVISADGQPAFDNIGVLTR